MHDARYGRAPARPHVRRRPRDGARRRQSAEQGRDDVRRSLRDQLGAGAVAAADHPVGDDGREERFHGGEKGNDERRRQQFADPRDADMRK